MTKKISAFCLFIFVAVFSLFFVSCGASQTVVIWTDRPEVVSYVEFFNVTQDKAKAVVVYKDNLATSLPPAKDEKRPDILIGSFLKNSRTKKNFAPLNGILGTDQVDSLGIYDSLMEYGTVGGKQYLLPVSFNMPVMIFSASKSPLVADSSLLDFFMLENIASVFNAKNSHEIYTNMGFAPSWNSQFLYEYAKSFNAKIQEKGNVFSWNAEEMESIVSELKRWTSEKNTTTTAEQDFSFKYLYTPEHKQVQSGKCLFAYTTSDSFFSLSPEQISDIDFRWLSNNGKVCVEDEIVTLGVYRKSVNTARAFDFIIWLFSETTQKNLLDRMAHMRLDTVPFGICSGFSSIESVNEIVFPAYYKNLLGNLPEPESLSCPLPLPSRWLSLKERVVLPYLVDATKNDATVAVKTIEERLTSWRKQFN
ncbi:MAG: hypothetical protein KBT11_01330 [Treponema sp.]|nr:hypothetical protein [Candidatus Treponema equifaecale]